MTRCMLSPACCYANILHVSTRKNVCVCVCVCLQVLDPAHVPVAHHKIVGTSHTHTHTQTHTHTHTHTHTAMPSR